MSYVKKNKNPEGAGRAWRGPGQPGPSENDPGSSTPGGGGKSPGTLPNPGVI